MLGRLEAQALAHRKDGHCYREHDEPCRRSIGEKKGTLGNAFRCWRHGKG